MVLGLVFDIARWFGLQKSKGAAFIVDRRTELACFLQSTYPSSNLQNFKGNRVNGVSGLFEEIVCLALGWDEN